MAVKLKTVEKYESYAEQCQHCRIKFCRIGCEIVDVLGSETITSYGKFGSILMAARGIQPIDESFAQLFAYCTTCEWCQQRCPNTSFAGDFYLRTQPTVPLTMEIRNELLQKGIIPNPAYPRILNNYKKTKGNVYGEPQKERLNWVQKGIKIARKAPLLFYVGCTSSYRTQLMAQATARILNKLDIPFMVLGEKEICCGGPLLRIGYFEEARQIAEDLIERLKATGAERIITSCPGCYKTFVKDWKYWLGLELDIEVIHLSQLLSELINAGKLTLKKSFEGTVTYHDPCHLGRGTHVYEDPRQVLENIPGINFVEMENIKYLARCCGAGGGFKASFPDLAVEIARRRLSEAQDIVGADIIVSTCPFCMYNLQDGIKKNKMRIKYMDLGDLVQRVM